MTKYTAEQVSAAADIRAAGARITLAKPGAVPVVVTRYAVEDTTKNPYGYQPGRRAKKLLVAVMATAGDTPNGVLPAELSAGWSATWAGREWSLHSAEPLAPDGAAILYTVVVVERGAAITFRSTTGTGATQNPPTGSGWTVGASALAGASSIVVKADTSAGKLAAGKLLAGDRLLIGTTTHTVTGSGETLANGSVAVPITPALAAPATAGDAVTWTFASDYPCHASIGSYEAAERQGGILAGDQRLIIMADEWVSAGINASPRPAVDKVLIGDRWLIIQSASADYDGPNFRAWELQVRGAP